MPNNLLDTLAKSLDRFTPRSVESFAGLILARHLNDESRVREYVAAVDRFGLRSASNAYHTCRARGTATPAVFFQLVEFNPSPRTSIGGPVDPVVAFQIGRRAISLAVFLGTELHHHQVRALREPISEAESTVAGFIRWTLAHFPKATVALEALQGVSERRTHLYNHAVSVIRDSSAPLWEVERAQLFQAYRLPEARDRHQFREAVVGIFPALTAESKDRAFLDAVGLGLFVQIMRLLDSGEEVTTPSV
jgi:hypothetical protein